MSRPRKNGPRVPEQADLHALLKYVPETGLFTWRKSRGGSADAGTPAGSMKESGYIRISVYGRSYFAHRLAWLYQFGRWPVDELDHINGCPSDNRIENLRQCDHFENHQNVGARKHNTSGYIGVTQHDSGSWVARIVVRRKKVNLGAFANKEDAARAYLEAKSKLHEFQPTPRAKELVDV